MSLCLLMSDADLALTRHIHTRESITHACIQMPVNITRKKSDAFSTNQQLESNTNERRNSWHVITQKKGGRF